MSLCMSMKKRARLPQGRHSVDKVDLSTVYESEVDGREAQGDGGDAVAGTVGAGGRSDGVEGWQVRVAGVGVAPEGGARSSHGEGDGEG